MHHIDYIIFLKFLIQSKNVIVSTFFKRFLKDCTLLIPLQVRDIVIFNYKQFDKNSF